MRVSSAAAPGAVNQASCRVPEASPAATESAGEPRAVVLAGHSLGDTEARLASGVGRVVAEAALVLEQDVE